MVWALSSTLLTALIRWQLANHIASENFGMGKEVWASFNFVLGVLLVFRTNQAYARYWEGATLLQQARGEWYNAASSVFAFCSPEQNKRREVRDFQLMMVRLMS